jgi:hypothetical protein
MHGFAWQIQGLILVISEQQHSCMPAIGQSAGVRWFMVDAVIHTTPPVCRCQFGACPSASRVVSPVRPEQDHIILELVFGSEVDHHSL